MNESINLELMRQALRAEICAQCLRRSRSTQKLGPQDRRPCEARCPIFRNLPRLVALAERRDPMLCTTPARAGAGRSPLSRYGARTIQVLERVLHH